MPSMFMAKQLINLWEDFLPSFLWEEALEVGEGLGSVVAGAEVHVHADVC